MRIILFLSVVVLMAGATTTSAVEPNKHKGSENSGLKKSVSFEDLLVQGQYQFRDESVVTVEQDKVLDSLLGVRKDFKDRIKKSATRY